MVLLKKADCCVDRAPPGFLADLAPITYRCAPGVSPGLRLLFLRLLRGPFETWLRLGGAAGDGNSRIFRRPSGSLTGTPPLSWFKTTVPTGSEIDVRAASWDGAVLPASADRYCDDGKPNAVMCESVLATSGATELGT